MLTREALEKRGLKYERTWLRWLPANYKLQTCEFDVDGEGQFITVDYLTYLLLWEMRLNRHPARITLTGPDGKIISVSNVKRHAVIKTKFLHIWYYTLVEIVGGYNEAELAEDVTL